MFKKYKIKVAESSESSLQDHFFCEICGFILRADNSNLNQSDEFCCNECYLTFIESRKDSWQEGWRPKKRDINKYINSRKKLIISTSKSQEKE